MPDRKGYLAGYEANLFRPLSAASLSCFQAGSGNELVGTGDRPAKMCALHSSSALVVNVFDYWIDRPDVILAALDLPTGGVSIKFEAQFPTGLDGNPPNLDVAIKWADGTWLGIESKFTEWLTPKPANKEVFRSKYFPRDSGIWSALGLHRCQQLAAAINGGAMTYRYLDAPQLLKHALGLACSGGPFELLYLYFDVQGPESRVQRAELDDFAERTGGDFLFHVVRYQDVYRGLLGLTRPEDREYVAYLGARYFPAA